MTLPDPPPVLGVCIVTYNAADVITGCLETLCAANEIRLRIVVVDNASIDGTVAHIRSWAKGTVPADLPSDLPFDPPSRHGPLTLQEVVPEDPLAGDAKLTMLHAPVNGGFAAGVNLGLAHLMQDPQIDRFWILNPDCVVPPGTPAALAAHPTPQRGFALMGGRVNYISPAGIIQSDGCRINWLTGATVNINRGLTAADTSPPPIENLDFIQGASMVASRTFLQQSGLLPEYYFLYYEEADWALRRGKLPLLYCDHAPVYHHAGSSIGSGTVSRATTAFSIYFLYRGRMRFLCRHCPQSLPVAFFHGLLKAGQHTLKGQWAQMAALLRAITALGPPPAVQARLSPEAARLAFTKLSKSRKKV